VIGHFVADLLVVGEAGVVPYIYVDNVRETLNRVTASGGEVAKNPYAEGNLIVATFRDPAGNIIGLWQQA
jgi:predicted enzyme related to lactoylglutathione lyase